MKVVQKKVGIRDKTVEERGLDTEGWVRISDETWCSHEITVDQATNIEEAEVLASRMGKSAVKMVNTLYASVCVNKEREAITRPESKVAVRKHTHKELQERLAAGEITEGEAFRLIGEVL